MKTWATKIFPKIFMGNNFSRTILIIMILAFFLQFIEHLFPLFAPIKIGPSGSDKGVTEIFILNAMRGKQSLGAYSRFGFKHPGPIFFYLSVPFYYFFGPAGISLTAALINFIALMIMVKYCYYQERKNSIPFIILLMIYMQVMMPVAISWWNPLIPVLPLGAFVFLCIRISTGNLKTLPLSVFLGSYITQSHIAFMPTIIVLSILTICFYLKNHSQELTKQKARLTISGALFFALWFLPLIEQINSEKGNLTSLFLFMMDNRTPAQDFGNALRVTLYMFASIPLALMQISGTDIIPLVEHFNPIFLCYISIIVLLFLIVGGYIWRKSLNPFHKHLIIFTLVGFIMGIISVRGIKGHLHAYLTIWITVFGFTSWLGSGYLLFVGPFKSVGKRIVIGSHEGLKTVICSIIALLSIIPASPNITINRLKHFGHFEYEHPTFETKINNYIGTLAHPPLIRIKQEVWGKAASAMSWLHKNNLKVSVEKKWLFMYGNQFFPTGNEITTILFTNEPELEKTNTGYELVAQSGIVYVYSFQEPDLSSSPYPSPSRRLGGLSTARAKL